MSKCHCNIHAGSIFARQATRLFENEIADMKWPVACTECKEEIAGYEGTGYVADFTCENQPNAGKKAICKTCYEIMICFFCSCGLGVMWIELRKKYETIGLSSFNELLSPEAAAVVVRKLDEWIEEDNNNELLES